MKIQLITLGCSKNRVDSEHILRQAIAAGYLIHPDGESLEGAGVDIVIINTCGFIQDAKQESIEVILEMVEAKNRGVISELYVFGCLSARYPKDLEEAIPEVDGFFGVNNYSELFDALGITPKGDLMNERVITTPKHYAYLKISEGCDRNCSYCAIPGIRGKHISVPIEDIISEAKYLVHKGVRELIVIAQDTTYYGLDLYKKRMLAPLLRELANIDGIEWIRLHYSYPSSFPEDVLEVMAASDKICKYIDIPLQHCSTKVLSNMRRGIDYDATASLIEKFRTAVPGVVLRTTMIVGHPGEGAKEFKELLSFVEKYRFERLGAFTYSEEENTWGAINLKDNVSKKTKESRYAQLMELQSQISLECNLTRVGSIERVIVDSYEDGTLHCRSQYESPEVDGEILVEVGAMPQGLIGKFINVRIIGADEYDLSAEII